MWVQYWERNVYGMVIMINIDLSTYWNKYVFESYRYSEQQYWWILYIASIYIILQVYILYYYIFLCKSQKYSNVCTDLNIQ